MSDTTNQPQPERTSPSPTVASATKQMLLHTEKLVKEYRQRRVVNGVSITVGAGEIVGLLGPNGAGKTTTFNMVVGVVRPGRRRGEVSRPRDHRPGDAPSARGWASVI